MKPDLYKIHIFITSLYLGVGLTIGLSFEAVGYSGSNTSIEMRWFIYPIVAILIALGVMLLRVPAISTKSALSKFLLFAVLSLSLVIGACILTESIDYLALLYSCFTLFLIARAFKSMRTF